MEISLQDLKPSNVEITLGGEQFVLRKVNAADEAWLKETFGKDYDILRNMKDEQLYRICFHQLRDEDKRKFTPIDCEIHNEDTGEIFKGTIGGWKLFRHRISGIHEKSNLYKALAETVGISRPMWDKILTEEEKKALLGIDQKKKTKQTGRK